MNIFIFKNGQQLGPFTLPELNRQRANGEIQNTDLVWHDEIPDWIPLSQLVSLTPLSPQPSVPPPFSPSAAPQLTGRIPFVARIFTALAVFYVSFASLFIVIYIIACIVCGLVLGVQTGMAENTPHAAEVKKTSDSFIENHGLMIMSWSALASFLFSILVAWRASCSDLFSWCRRT